MLTPKDINEYELKHLGRVRELSAECTLFLQRDHSFPLDKAGRIAVFGSGARHTVKGGTGSGEVNSRFSVNIEEGLKDDGFTITTTEWLDKYDEVYKEAYKAFIEDIKAEAKKLNMPAMFVGMGKICPEPEYEIPLTVDGEAAIYVLSRISGEGNDRTFTKGDFSLTETEIRDINLLSTMYDKFMLVVNCGGPVDLTPVKHVKNILVLSQLGVLTGKILADILLGKLYPSGKLTTTWAKPEDYYSDGTFAHETDSYYKEGVYVGYRYFDTVGKKASYPFGFGLGYTDFELGKAEVTLEGQTVKVSVPVKNIGSFVGKEVIQVYVSVPEGKLKQPLKTLAAFAKTKELKPSETQKVSAEFKLDSIASYDESTTSYILEKGSYIVLVGNSSDNVSVSAAVDVPETLTVRKVKSCTGEYDFEEEVFERVSEYEVGENTPVLKLDTTYIETEEVDYTINEEIDPTVSALNDEDLMRLNIGSFNPKGGLASVIGDASKTVAGAAGETATINNEIPVLVMADGPAGIRISKHYTIDKDGVVHSETGMVPDSVKELMPPVMAPIEKIKSLKTRKEKVYDHYATAIPIGTALAQSFNPSIAEICGDIVGNEMERFGIHLWLAPALNIHRSVLCGRNFEYYSEDPLVSGKFAAAITNGVQKHPGRSTTIKHYCANSQETNRYNSNSHVSERAMREIYLRGFEICVKESHPHTLMTSYNLLNGVHTSERKDLIDGILRAEFGFDGVVMTDWVIAMMSPEGSKYRGALSPYVAAAGNDLFMPGSPEDLENMKNGLKDGIVTREQLEINGTRIYKLTKELTEAIANNASEE